VRRAHHWSRGFLKSVMCLGFIVKTRQKGDPGPLEAVVLGGRKKIASPCPVCPSSLYLPTWNTVTLVGPFFVIFLI